MRRVLEEDVENDYDADVVALLLASGHVLDEGARSRRPEDAEGDRGAKDDSVGGGRGL